MRRTCGAAGSCVAAERPGFRVSKYTKARRPLRDAERPVGGCQGRAPKERVFARRSRVGPRRAAGPPEVRRRGLPRRLRRPDPGHGRRLVRDLPFRDCRRALRRRRRRRPRLSVRGSPGPLLAWALLDLVLRLWHLRRRLPGSRRRRRRGPGVIAVPDDARERSRGLLARASDHDGDRDRPRRRLRRLPPRARRPLPLRPALRRPDRALGRRRPHRHNRHLRRRRHGHQLRRPLHQYGPHPEPVRLPHRRRRPLRYLHHPDPLHARLDLPLGLLRLVAHDPTPSGVPPQHGKKTFSSAAGRRRRRRRHSRRGDDDGSL
mmetsp:Transcript_36252/g.116118  ORF Transcript_36252/g.116118 Transcript_36252/m.116118 type:complete len:318 (+) Transcript_36252:576-1529(+)